MTCFLGITLNLILPSWLTSIGNNYLTVHIQSDCVCHLFEAFLICIEYTGEKCCWNSYEAISLLTSFSHLLGWGVSTELWYWMEGSCEEPDKAVLNSLSAYSLNSIWKDCPNTDSLKTSLLKLMSVHLYTGGVDDFCFIFCRWQFRFWIS